MLTLFFMVIGRAWLARLPAQNPDQGAWITLAARMSTPRDALIALAVDNRVFLIGGRTRPSGATTATADQFDPSTRAISPLAQMSGSRSFCPPVLLIDGSILTAGGFRQVDHDTTLRASELLLRHPDRWVRLPPLSVPRELHTETLLPDGTALIAAGFSNGRILNTSELYLPRSHRFTSTGSLHVPRFGHSATLTPDGLLVIGGRTRGDVSLRSTEMYNQKAKCWTFGPSTIQDRFRHTATLLADGRILIAGGYSSLLGRTLDTAEIYDPASGLFHPVASHMSDGRMDHTATQLQDGRVLIAGGWCSEQRRTVASVDIFDPRSEAFIPAAALPSSRHEQAAVLLPDGSLLVAGGLQVEPSGQRTLDDLLIFRP